MKAKPLAALLVLLGLSLPVTGTAETAYERARAFVSRGALDSAMALSDSSLAADSANPGMWVIKAEIHAARADRDQQMTALQTALHHSPFYADAILEHARAYLDSGLVDSAAHCLPPFIFRPGPSQIDALCLQARIVESLGRADSAIGLYQRAYEILDRRALLRLPPARMQRLSQVSLESDKGIASVWRLGVPSIFLFWADWAPQSTDAFGEIVENLKGAGITWRFVPINVNSSHPDPQSIARAVSQARELGYKDTVWIDNNLTIFRAWNIDRVPTVIVTNINGDVDVTQTGWSDDTRHLIVDQYLGSYTDSADTTASHVSAERVRSRYLIETARVAAASGYLEQAVRQANNAVKADPQFSLAHVALAVWRWQRGDTLGARMAAYNALQADSLDPWANIAVGRIEYLHGQNQSAFELMQRSIARDSGFVPAWRLLGHCAIALGDTNTANAAIQAIERYNKLDLELPVLQAMLAAPADPVRAAVVWRRVFAKHP